MKNTGQILKEAREKKGISIAEVSLATKINSRILTAMEQGNLSKLPPKTFLRGFVHSYSQFLGLDPDAVLKTFQEEMGPTKPAADSPEASLAASAPTAERAAPSTMSRAGNGSFAKLGVVVGIIVLVIVIILVKKKMDSYESESIQAPVETVVATATPEGNPSAVSPSPSPSPASASAVVATATATATPTATPTPKPTTTPVPSSTATSTPKPSPSATATSTPTLAASASPTATPAATGKVQDVTIEALDDVEISAVIDGETRSIKLAADQVHTIKAKRKVSLQLSDGGAVSIIVNGIDRGVPGDLGKPKKVDIP